ncbi:hypothetical protein BEN74_04160 [Acinetobacter sp. WCHAc010034]|uniref:hypothetical protein n=1 Tax=Acinetobacter sp. WCHAc010034 TaxID=1879049 RepID=UPI00083B48F7|nr:hypothetical protein [Acinetobacter sp. WCHAc010034]AYA02141.1 hypothetical protein BEN74_04160 [Acinetobacter sp. WCHAc010034]
MIEKIENPLNLGLDQVDVLLAELQKTSDEYSDDLGIFSLDESGVSIEIKTKSSEYSYSLEQLKKLKVELEDPLLQSLREVP